MQRQLICVFCTRAAREHRNLFGVFAEKKDEVR